MCPTSIPALFPRFRQDSQSCHLMLNFSACTNRHVASPKLIEKRLGQLTLFVHIERCNWVGMSESGLATVRTRLDSAKVLTRSDILSTLSDLLYKMLQMSGSWTTKVQAALKITVLRNRPNTLRQKLPIAIQLYNKSLTLWLDTPSHHTI